MFSPSDLATIRFSSCTSDMWSAVKVSRVFQVSESEFLAYSFTFP